MARRLLINTSEPEEIRAALMVDGRLEEFERESSRDRTLVGNVYKGCVVNLEPGIGAAFVDVGLGRNAFLHVSDVVGAQDGDRIADHLQVGDDVIVQVTRDSIGDKGPVLTAHVTLPGRFVVLLPHAQAGGVSRRIEDREKLRDLARELEQLTGTGLILRTASFDRGRAQLRRDAQLLARLWERLSAQAAEAQVPALLFAHTDLVGRAVRDADRIDEIVVDTPEALERAKEAARTVEPELEEALRLHDDDVPLFHAYAVEEQVDVLRERRVALPGGGSLVIDRTEALVAVDVNSGRTRHEDGLEETALQTNLEAAAEVARQLRLRDLGGVVVVDFIDMKDPAHVREVERAFKRHLKRDPVHLRPGRLGVFGIFVLTRQRAGGGSVGGSGPCPHCGGSGVFVQPEQVALRIWRELRARGAAVVHTGPEVAEALQSLRGKELTALGGSVALESAGDLPAAGWRI